MAASCEASEVIASQRPATKAPVTSSYFSMVTGFSSILLARKKSARLSSVVVPVCTQTVAPESSLALFTPSFFVAMKPWPS